MRSGVCAGTRLAGMREYDGGHLPDPGRHLRDPGGDHAQARSPRFSTTVSTMESTMLQRQPDLLNLTGMFLLR